MIVVYVAISWPLTVQPNYHPKDFRLPVVPSGYNWFRTALYNNNTAKPVSTRNDSNARNNCKHQGDDEIKQHYLPHACSDYTI